MELAMTIEVDVSPTGENLLVTPEAAASDVPTMILSRAENPDTTIAVSDTRQDDERQILVSLSGGKAFVGLTLGGQQFQLARQVSEGQAVVMVIGGQAASIATRFVLEPSYAARAVASFVMGDPLSDPDLMWIAQ